MAYTQSLDAVLRNALRLKGALINILPQKAIEAGKSPVFGHTFLGVSSQTPWVDPSPGLLDLESSLHSDLAAKYDRENRKPFDLLQVKISYPEGILDFNLSGEGISQMIPVMIAG